jgi:hypothetical protein
LIGALMPSPRTVLVEKLARWCVAAVFAVAGGTKLGDPRAFEDTLVGRLVPAELLVLAVLAELSLAVWLMSGRARVLAWGTSSAVLCTFAAFLVTSFVNGESRPCGCFGAASAVSEVAGRDALLASGLRASFLAAGSTLFCLLLGSSTRRRADASDLPQTARA